jgi:hypothetical protein
MFPPCRRLFSSAKVRAANHPGLPLRNVILLYFRQEIRPAGRAVLETPFESDQVQKNCHMRLNWLTSKKARNSVALEN